MASQAEVMSSSSSDASTAATEAFKDELASFKEETLQALRSLEASKEAQLKEMKTTVFLAFSAGFTEMRADLTRHSEELSEAIEARVKETFAASLAEGLRQHMHQTEGEIAEAAQVMKNELALLKQDLLQELSSQQEADRLLKKAAAEDATGRFLEELSGTIQASMKETFADSLAEELQQHTHQTVGEIEKAAQALKQQRAEEAAGLKAEVAVLKQELLQKLGCGEDSSEAIAEKLSERGIAIQDQLDACKEEWKKLRFDLQDDLSLFRSAGCAFKELATAVQALEDQVRCVTEATLANATEQTQPTEAHKADRAPQIGLGSPAAAPIGIAKPTMFTRRFRSVTPPPRMRVVLKPVV